MKRLALTLTTFLPFATLAVAAACGSSTAGSGDPATDGGVLPEAAPADAALDAGGDGPAASDAGGDAAIACNASTACFRTTCSALGEDDCTPTFDGCPTNQLCGEASFLETGGSSTGGPIKYGANGADTETNARCALEALRDGKVGRWSWGFSGGVHSYGEKVTIVDGRRAFGTFSEAVDSPSTRGGYGNVALKPASYFDTCLATNDLDAYARCFKDAFEPCQ